jgi:hypothetical protein
MKLPAFLATALFVPQVLPAPGAIAQTAVTPAAADYSNSPLLPGSWSYVAVPGGSIARFTDATGTIRVSFGCNRTSRGVTIARTSAAPAASLSFWTSTSSRNQPAMFEQPAQRVVATFNAQDTMLDAIVFSRGRFAVSMPGAPALVIPTGPEASRIVEDCRG